MTNHSNKDGDLRDAIDAAHRLSAELSRLNVTAGQKYARSTTVSPYVAQIADLFPSTQAPARQPVQTRARTSGIDSRKRRMLREVFGEDLALKIIGEAEGHGQKTGPLTFPDLNSPTGAELDQAGEELRLNTLSDQMQTLLGNIAVAPDLTAAKRYDLLVQAAEAFLERLRIAGAKSSPHAAGFRAPSSPYIDDIRQLFGGQGRQ